MATAVPEGVLVIAPHPNEQLAKIIISLERNPHTFFLSVTVSRITGVESALKGQRLKIISLSGFL